ncbi:hypothetical protein DENSPDRAFT_839384 [Dentipellis sp. KUC8613]|nr:hypothetical protein DENSPDRAFT_839384 [Dentipellis sp. KUC8613]
MLLPPLNDDCARVVLSMLGKPELAALSRVSRPVASYIRPWLVRNVNVAKTTPSRSIDLGALRFVLKYDLGSYIQALTVFPPSGFVLDLAALLPVVDEFLRLLADVIESAVNLCSFRMYMYQRGYLEREPRILLTLQQRSLLQKLQFTDIGQADVDALLSTPISNLRCLQITVTDFLDVGIVFEIAGLSAQTLDELSISYTPPVEVYEQEVGSGNPSTVFPHVQRLALLNITMAASDIARAFPHLQHLKLVVWGQSALPAPFFFPSGLPNNVSFPELRSIAGHSGLMALPIHANLQRLRIDQTIISKDMFDEALQTMAASPLTSVSLIVRTRSAGEKRPRARAAQTREAWPYFSPTVISKVASCIPRVQFFELGFNWGRFRAYGLSPETCVKSALCLESACAPLAELKDLRYASFTVPGARDGAEDIRPNMQSIFDHLFNTLPNVKHLSARSKGMYQHRFHYRRRAETTSHAEESTVSSSTEEHPCIETTSKEALAAYERYSWEATGLKGWCVGGHEWQ